MGYSVKSYGLKWDLLYYCILECSSVQQGWSDTLESASESGFLIRNKKGFLVYHYVSLSLQPLATMHVGMYIDRCIGGLARRAS